jgi:hypothetical protein
MESEIYFEFIVNLLNYLHNLPSPTASDQGYITDSIRGFNASSPEGAQISPVPGTNRPVGTAPYQDSPFPQIFGTPN